MNGAVQPTQCEHGIDLLARCDACRENLDVRIIRDAIRKHSLTRFTEDEIRRRWRAYSQETEGVAWLTVSRVWTPAMVWNFLSWSPEAVRAARLKKNLQILNDIAARQRFTEDEPISKAEAFWQEKLTERAAEANAAAVAPGQATWIDNKLYMLDPKTFAQVYYRKPPIDDAQRRNDEAAARMKLLREVYEEQVRAGAKWPMRSELAQLTNDVEQRTREVIGAAAEAIWQSNGPSIGPPRVITSIPAAPAVGTGPRRYFDE